MAGLDAVHQVGESIAALLRARRNLLSASGGLGPVPASLDISQIGTGRLGASPAPTAGLTLTCWRIVHSDHAPARPEARLRADKASASLELGFLVVPWASDAREEHGVLAWAMLELSRYAVLDRSLLTGANVWEREETIQIVPENASADDLFRIWAALQLRYRLSATFRARVVRVRYGVEDPGPPVVASRFDLRDADPLAPAPATGGAS
jgi:hypothetical protein